MIAKCVCGTPLCVNCGAHAATYKNRPGRFRRYCGDDCASRYWAIRRALHEIERTGRYGRGWNLINRERARMRAEEVI